MKVRTWVETYQEVEVEVTLNDMFASIAELERTDQPQFVLHAISSALRILKDMPQPLRDAIMPAPREKILGYLAEIQALYAAHSSNGGPNDSD